MKGEPLYAEANLFVGKYTVPENGHIRLPPGTRVRFLRGVVDAKGWHEHPEGEMWLIVEDGNFWPVMIHVGDDTMDMGQV